MEIFIYLKKVKKYIYYVQKLDYKKYNSCYWIFGIQYKILLTSLINVVMWVKLI